MPSGAVPTKKQLLRMRKIMNISVSEEMYSLILDRAKAGCHSTVSEYIRSLVRRDLFEHRGRRATKPSRPRPRRANEYFTQATVYDADVPK
jgi:Arc/MetJ-type ribon-helix-helix transcriptional regulator